MERYVYLVKFSINNEDMRLDFRFEYIKLIHLVLANLLNIKP
jgi:hypothetical protein